MNLLLNGAVVAFGPEYAWFSTGLSPSAVMVRLGIPGTAFTPPASRIGLGVTVTPLWTTVTVLPFSAAPLAAGPVIVTVALLADAVYPVVPVLALMLFATRVAIRLLRCACVCAFVQSEAALQVIVP